MPPARFPENRGSQHHPTDESAYLPWKRLLLWFRKPSRAVPTTIWNCASGLHVRVRRESLLLHVVATRSSTSDLATNPCARRSTGMGKFYGALCPLQVTNIGVTGNEGQGLRAAFLRRWSARMSCVPDRHESRARLLQLWIIRLRIDLHAVAIRCDRSSTGVRGQLVPGLAGGSEWIIVVSICSIARVAAAQIMYRSALGHEDHPE